MKKQQTFESASNELEEILEKISDEETSLDECLALYAKAAELISFCNETLKQAQIRVEEIDAQIAEMKL